MQLASKYQFTVQGEKAKAAAKKKPAKAEPAKEVK
tara:strand:+ start:411 stop:515 length:105 start_codon:yes stop_codon:yes gene_type:complete